jgi:hypothetical protein
VGQEERGLLSSAQTYRGTFSTSYLSILIR